MAEIGDLQHLASNLGTDLVHFVMRPGEESLQQAEFVQHLQCRRMHGVAAEIAQEIRVLFQHHDLDAGARQQKAQHHAGGTAADHAAGDGERWDGHPTSPGPRRWRQS